MSQAIIELKNIEVIYKNSLGVPFRALRNINFAVKEGDFVAIMGPSGSGKTTIANVIGLLKRIDAGEYFVLSKPTHLLGDDERSRLRSSVIGFIFQDYILIEHLTALENVALALNYSNLSRAQIKTLAREKLELLGLGERLQNYPRQLSGGQKQRVAIARALIKNPKVILADEPAAALDLESRTDVLGALQGLNDQGVTVVMITHSDKDARIAKRLVRLDDGQITEDSLILNRTRFISAPDIKGAVGQFAAVVGVHSATEFFQVISSPIGPDFRLSMFRQVHPAWFQDINFRQKLFEQWNSLTSLEKCLALGTLLKAWGRFPGDSECERHLKELKETQWSELEAEALIRLAMNADEKSVMEWFPIRQFFNHESSRVRASSVWLLGCEVLRNSDLIGEILSSLISDEDSRVRSNTLDACLRYNIPIRFFKDCTLGDDKSGRVRGAWARLLLKEGRQEEAFGILRQMVLSDDVIEMKTVAYVLSNQDRLDFFGTLEKLLADYPKRLTILNCMAEVSSRLRRNPAAS